MGSLPKIVLFFEGYTPFQFFKKEIYPLSINPMRTGLDNASPLFHRLKLVFRTSKK